MATLPFELDEELTGIYSFIIILRTATVILCFTQNDMEQDSVDYFRISNFLRGTFMFAH
tara:strand:- start:281 stop:457 length:177 start_codon:yes stop_codon:yes gene_type:complete